MQKRFFILIPFLAGLAVAALVIYGYRVENADHLRLTRSNVLQGLSDVKAELVKVIQEQDSIAEAMDSAVKVNPDISIAEFTTIAEDLTHNSHAVRSIQLARNNVVSHSFPSKGGLPLGINLDESASATLRSMASRAKQTGFTQINFPDPSIAGASGVMTVCAPITIPDPSGNDTYWGLTIFHIQTSSLLDKAGLSRPYNNIAVALRIPNSETGNGPIVAGNTLIYEMDPLIADVHVFDDVWQLAAAPKYGWTNSPRSPYILGGGALLVLLIPVALWFMLSAFLGRFKDREKYRYLVQTAKAVILRIDMSGKIEFCNEYAEEYFGYAPDELLGQPLVGTLIPEKGLDGQSMKRHLGKLLKDPSAHPFNETMSKRKDGDIVWVSWTNQSILASDDTIVGLLCVGTDITDRKLMEESLRQREKQYRLLAENVSDIIWGLDADLRYTYASPSDETIRGFKRYEVLGQHIDDFLKPASRDIIRAALERLNDKRKRRQTSPSETADMEFICADGSTVWLESKLGLMLNDEGDVIGIQGVSRDITDRKLAEALREDMERMAKHDLKTPLGAVVGLPEEIRRLGPISADQEALLETIENAGNAMLNLINRSIDLYKMECGTYILEKQPVDVCKVIERIKAEAQPQIRDKGISIGVEVNGNAPLLVSADAGHFQSMLSNLILNALQASPESGTISVLLDKEPDVTITIRNQGEVPEHIREVFFEKYATSNNASGSGLGTYSARLIARTHGGDISVDTSVPGQTSVKVTLPY